MRQEFDHDGFDHDGFDHDAKARSPTHLVPSGDPLWRLPGGPLALESCPHGRAQNESHSSSHSEFTAITLKLCDPSF
jgi:hypothetical protein